jgi:hypothetical protein
VCLLVCRTNKWSVGARLPDGFGKLTSLEELRASAVGYDDSCNKGRFVRELGSLVELRVLNAEIIGRMDESVQRYLLESLHNLHKVQDLTITHGGHCGDELNRCRCSNMGSTQQGLIELPRHLRRLSISTRPASGSPGCRHHASTPPVFNSQPHLFGLVPCFHGRSAAS